MTNVAEVTTVETHSSVTDKCVDSLSVKSDNEFPLVIKEAEGGADSTSNEKPKSSFEDENKMGGPTFFPPLYIQRYSFVSDVLNRYKATNVVDLGSSECQIIRLLTDVLSLWSIILVDLDKPTLEANLMKIKPGVFHYLNKKDRQHPLVVKVLHGNATETDQRIMGCDALSMVEFVEHLYPDDLNKVTKIVFSEVQPRIVIVTTPNFEFNQLFPKDGRVFRHYDHKFEWTRSEFQKWGNDICERYGYSAEYTGIGEGPPDAKHLGYCSQAAVFERVQDQGNLSKADIPLRYTLLAESHFPYQEKQSVEDSLAMEISYYIREEQISHRHDNIDDDTSGNNSSTVVPLSKLIGYRSLSQLCTKEKLREYLKSENYSFTEDGEGIIIPRESAYSSEEEEENYYEDIYDEDKVESRVSVDRQPYQEEESWD